MPNELPRIKNWKAYLDGLDDLPDWRITCFFVGKGQRRQVAAAALAGALEEIARLGGGIVESYPDEVEDKPTSASFLHNATVTMFERRFERTRQIGKTRWVSARPWDRIRVLSIGTVVVGVHDFRRAVAFKDRGPRLPARNPIADSDDYVVLVPKSGTGHIWRSTRAWVPTVQETPGPPRSLRR